MNDINGISIEIIADYNTSLNEWLSNNNLITKSGSLFKNVSITAAFYQHPFHPPPR